MKTYQTFRSLFRFVFLHTKWSRKSKSIKTAFDASNPIESSAFGIIHLLPCLHIVLCCLLCLCFLFIEADTFQEYSDGVYGVLVSLGNFFVGFAVFSNRVKFFEFIDNIEKMIKKRK